MVYTLCVHVSMHACMSVSAAAILHVCVCSYTCMYASFAAVAVAFWVRRFLFLFINAGVYALVSVVFLASICGYNFAFVD